MAAAAIAADAPPLELTAEQDHKLMMDQLGITSIREGANGRDPSAPNAANYDEAKGNPYPVLPDVLKLDNGKPVKNAKQWWEQRRPQIVEHFDREVYGRLPKSVPGVTWSVAETKNDTSGGAGRHAQTRGSRRQLELPGDQRRHRALSNYTRRARKACR